MEYTTKTDRNRRSSESRGKARFDYAESRRTKAKPNGMVSDCVFVVNSHGYCPHRQKTKFNILFGINEQNRLKNGICVILCPT